MRFFGFHRESRLHVAVPEFCESETVFDVTATEAPLNSSDVPIKPIFVGLGEVLWDVFPDGRRPGGAPANFAWHVNQLGAHGLVVSRVGDDRLGDELVGILSERGLDSDHVQRDSEQSTGTVSITTTADGQPDYTIHEPVAWDWPGSDLSETTEFIQDRYGLDGVWVTRGAGGCLLRGVDELVECSGIEVEVADTVGAGDSFTAAMIWSSWLGYSLSESAELANRVGALVASRQGGMPDL